MNSARYWAYRDAGAFGDDYDPPDEVERRTLTLREIQKRIAEAKGYKHVGRTLLVEDRRPLTPGPDLHGVLHADEGSTLIPRWPWDWCDAGELVEEMLAAAVDPPQAGEIAGVWLSIGPLQSECTLSRWGGAENERYGLTPQEAIARAWLAWKGIDLSDLP